MFKRRPPIYSVPLLELTPLSNPPSIRHNTAMSTEPEEYEHGGEYQPDAFGALNSIEDLKGEGHAVGCLLLYLFVAIVFVAELLRYATGSAKWWPLLIAIPFFFPRVWAAFRLGQNPDIAGIPAVSGMSLRDKRLGIAVVVGMDDR